MKTHTHNAQIERKHLTVNKVTGHNNTITRVEYSYRDNTVIEASVTDNTVDSARLYDADDNLRVILDRDADKQALTDALNAHINPAQEESTMKNTVHIEVNIDNAAFHDSEGNPAPASEVARILRTLATDIDSGDIDPSVEPRALLDINGHRVGAIFIN